MKKSLLRFFDKNACTSKSLLESCVQKMSRSWKCVKNDEKLQKSVKKWLSKNWQKCQKSILELFFRVRKGKMWEGQVCANPKMTKSQSKTCQNRQKSMCKNVCAIKNLSQNWQKHQSVLFAKIHKKYCENHQKVSKVKSRRQILKSTFQKWHDFLAIFLPHTHPNQKMSEKTVKNSQKSSKITCFWLGPCRNWQITNAEKIRKKASKSWKVKIRTKPKLAQSEKKRVLKKCHFRVFSHHTKIIEKTQKWHFRVSKNCQSKHECEKWHFFT